MASPQSKDESNESKSGIADDHLVNKALSVSRGDLEKILLSAGTSMAERFGDPSQHKANDASQSNAKTEREDKTQTSHKRKFPETETPFTDAEILCVRHAISNANYAQTVGRFVL